jgi:serine/threonine-protein kinase
MNQLVGKTLGSYQVLEPIGQSEWPTLYKAHDLAHDRFVSLSDTSALAKVPTFLEDFPNKIQAIVRLAHPHILPVYDFGEQDGVYYIVMEYPIPSDNLQRYLEGASA